MLQEYEATQYDTQLGPLLCSPVSSRDAAEQKEESDKQASTKICFTLFGFL